MRVLATVVPPGQRVLNDRGDGSAWMYATSACCRWPGTTTRRCWPNASGTIPTIRRCGAAVTRRGVHYMMLDRGFVRDHQRQPGFIGLDGVRWLEVVYRNQDAVIYRIRPHTPERP
jgi:hypothetical protein